MPLIHTKCFIFFLWRNGWQVPVHRTCIRYPAESRCCMSSIMEHLQCKAHPPPFTWIQSAQVPSISFIRCNISPASVLTLHGTHFVFPTLKYSHEDSQRRPRCYDCLYVDCPRLSDKSSLSLCHPLQIKSPKHHSAVANYSTFIALFLKAATPLPGCVGSSGCLCGVCMFIPCPCGWFITPTPVIHLEHWQMLISCVS